MGELTDVTRMQCPEEPELTHHMLPSKGEMRCAYCDKTTTMILDEAAQG